ncbi:GT2 family glycosyltransferase [Kineococcus aurantiacus]|uniref:GT2 family glycosyltransferase n=1 Tax=Kineococcus aurantiacus TaxID=37633 RepID=A0A7Y9ATN5_9ACTN|nr:GT2 family glycosyltransferase [Kineococcus aurantiacus]
MPDVPDVTVVVPCWNVVGVVENQLAALAAQDFEGTFEVVLSDNGSTDGLPGHVPGWAARYGLDLRCVDSSGVQGVSRARNVGLRAARADVVAVCDADDVVVPGWLSSLVRAMEGADLVGGTMDVVTPNDAVRRAWRPGPTPGALQTRFGFLPFAMGCNLAVRRDVALAVGGWDESYVAGGDDVDFSWRVQLAGHRIGLAEGAVVQYRYRSDLRGTARQFRDYARNEARLLAQYRPHGARAPEGVSRADARWLLRHGYHLVQGPGRRGRWVCRAARLIGREQGRRTYSSAG